MMRNEAALEELDEGIHGSISIITNREVRNAMCALDKYVGVKDTVYDLLAAEFAAASSAEQQAQSDKFDLRSIFWAHTNPEVPLALTLAQFELCEDTMPRLRDGYWGRLQHPAMQEKITTRFPEMTRARITTAIEHVRPLITLLLTPA